MTGHVFRYSYGKVLETVDYVRGRIAIITADIEEPGLVVDSCHDIPEIERRYVLLREQSPAPGICGSVS